LEKLQFAHIAARDSAERLGGNAPGLGLRELGLAAV